MAKESKKYNFENREQLIELLSLTIELVDKHFYRYCVYYEELIMLANDKIKEISGFDKLKINEENIYSEIRNVMQLEQYMYNHNDYKINYIEYKSMEDKIVNVQSQLLNLLGDRTKKGGVSYWRFRYEYRKLKDEKNNDLPELEMLSQEFNELMNDMNSMRNYLHHMTDAKFIEWADYRKRQMRENPNIFKKWPDAVIVSERYENVSIEWLWQLVLSQIEFKKDVRKILQQMKKDYSCLYGESMRIQKKWKDELDNSSFEISINGVKRHLGKLR